MLIPGQLSLSDCFAMKAGAAGEAARRIMPGVQPTATVETERTRLVGAERRHASGGERRARSNGPSASLDTMTVSLYLIGSRSAATTALLWTICA